MTQATKDVFQVVAGSEREYLIRRFKMVISSAHSQLAKFCEDVVKDPARAFEWSDKSFEAAAKVTAYNQALYMLESGTDIKTIQSVFHDNVMHGAMFRSKSTSAASNLIKEYQTAQQAELLHMIRNIESLDIQVIGYSEL